MAAFDYLAVLISIILGLGIAQLLAGFGRWIEQRGAFRPFAPAMLWASTLLLIHVQTWWSMFGLRELADWTFLRFALVLLQPITLYLMAILALPGPGSTQTDLRANYFAQRRWFFGLLLFLLGVSVLKDAVISGSLPGSANLAFHGAFLATGLIALLSTREKIHLAIAIVAAAMMVAYVALLFGQLQ